LGSDILVEVGDVVRPFLLSDLELSLLEDLAKEQAKAGKVDELSL